MITGAVAVAAFAAAGLGGCSSPESVDADPTTAGRLSPTSAPALPFTAQDAATLTEDLASGDPEQVRRAVSLPIGATLPADTLAALTDMDAMTFDLATFTDHGDGTADVRAIVGDAQWTVFLVDSSGRWLIAATSEEA